MVVDSILAVEELIFCLERQCSAHGERQYGGAKDRCKVHICPPTLLIGRSLIIMILVDELFWRDFPWRQGWNLENLSFVVCMAALMFGRGAMRKSSAGCR
jgi:hypothetical protein